MAVAPGMVLAADGPLPPQWRAGTLTNRALVPFGADTGAAVLVSLPPVDSTNTALQAFDDGGQPLAAEVLSGSADQRLVWVPTVRGKTPVVSPLWIYFGGAEGAVPATRAVVNDPEPWRVEVFAVSGVGVPDRWERMAFMRQQAAAATRRFFLPTLYDITQEQAGGRNVQRALIEARTHIRVSEPGEYRFALNCRHAGFLLLDDTVVAEWPEERDAGRWVSGPPVDLSPGIHRLTVLNYYTRSDAHTLRVGWQLPDASETVVIPEGNLLSAHRIESPLIESQGRVLHPGFRYSVQPAYRVHGAGATFIPVTFEAMTADWLAATPSTPRSEVVHRWRFGDGVEAEGNRVVHIYTRPGPVTVQLQVADDGGEQATVERQLEIQPRRLRESRLDAGLAGVPFALYRNDRISPELWIIGDFQSRPVDIAWRIDRADASSRASVTQGVPTATNTLTIPLGADLPAGAITALTWRVSHAQATLSSGALIVQPPPFTGKPVSVMADQVMTAGATQIVWVTDAAPARRDAFRPPSRRMPAPSPVVWLTDVPGMPADHGAFDVRLMQPWDQRPGMAGPLVKIMDLCEILAAGPPRTLVLGFGVTEFSKGVDLAVFERQVAVLTDWLLGLDGIGLFWATPPPVGDPVAIRPYAAAIRRIADARGVPVVDLYSYFMGADDQGHDWIEAAPMLGVTPEGAAAARRVVAGTLFGGPY